MIMTSWFRCSEKTRFTKFMQHVSQKKYGRRS